MISIIIPCFNSEEYLEECFESIKNQTYKDFEIIFVNDGSADNTQNILERIKADNENLDITVYNRENKGVSSARNIGMELAKGEYIGFIDADDYIYPDFLEVLYGARMHGDLPVVGIDGNGFRKSTDRMEGIINKDKFVYEFWLTQHLWGSANNKLYQKEIILKNNLKFNEEVAVMEDMLFNMEYCQHINTIYVSNKNLYYYRLSNNSVMHRSFSDKKMTVLKMFDKLLELEFNKEDKEIIELHKVNSLIWLFGQVYKDYNNESSKKYEKEIILELSRSDKKIFIRKGLKKGIKRYASFWICFINPKIYKSLIGFYCRLKNR